MNIALCNEYNSLRFDIEWITTKPNKVSFRDDIEHFSFHAMIARRDYIWSTLMSEIDRRYIEDERQANFETTMLMIELDSTINND